MSDKALFPVEESPEFVQESEQLDSRYKYTVAWDTERGDFVLNGKNQMEKCNGIEGLKVWCCKMALTQRYSCLAYPSEIGTELREALDEPTEEAVESAIERTITESLMTNPRVEYVKEFEFQWDGDSVQCQFLVKGIDGDEFQVSI